ncbi:MAG: hypothetical protein ACI4KO_01165 [Ruminiclostridium sp.]
MNKKLFIFFFGQIIGNKEKYTERSAVPGFPAYYNRSLPKAFTAAYIKKKKNTAH